MTETRIMNKQDTCDYNFVMMVLNNHITESPIAVKLTNARLVLDATGFTKLVVIKKVLSDEVCTALNNAGFSTNRVGSTTEIFKVSRS